MSALISALMSALIKREDNALMPAKITMTTPLTSFTTYSISPPPPMRKMGSASSSLFVLALHFYVVICSIMHVFHI